MIYETVLTNADERYAPPEQPVLRICVVQDDDGKDARVFLEIAELTETFDTATYTRVASFQAEGDALLAALGALFVAGR